VAQAAKSPAPRRRAGKSATAFRTISEVSKELDVPPHVLRFWESKFAQVKPLKRGGGRRYYRPEDIDLLRSIRELLYTEGYTIKGVQKLLREGGAKFAAPPPSAAPAAVTAIPAAEAAPAAPPTDGHIQDELREILDELELLRDLLRAPLD
jgi:DNA-binding transcriptional MerR regulator